MKRVKWPFEPRKIAAAESLDSHAIQVRWEDGETAVIDLSTWLRGKGVERLADSALFARAHVGEDGWSVAWVDDELEIDSLHLQFLQSEQRGVPVLPESFRRWRERQGLTQAQTGQALGLSLRMVQNYEAGQSPIPLTVGLACRGWEASRGQAA